MGTQPDERPWYLYYMALAAANVLLLALTNLVFTGIGETIVAFVVVASFLALTAVHAATHYRNRDGSSGSIEET